MWGLVLFVIVLVLLAGAAAVLPRKRRPLTPAAGLRRGALIFMAAVTTLTGLFIAGETIADPGGWLAAAMIALWLVPLAVLSLLAWYQPGWAVTALAILLAGAVAVAIWFAVDPAGWHGFENAHGPVRAVISFILALPAALAGWRRPLAGAVLLLVLGLAPLAISAAGSAAGSVSLLAVSVPPLIGGAAYLLAALAARRSASAPPPG